MKAIINISGEISPNEASLTDVIAQFKAFENPTEIELNVNSIGGYVAEGDAIYNYLKSLQLPITTITKDMCMSIATKLFLLGDVRKVDENCEFMIHNPFLDEVSGDADFLLEASNHVRAIEEDLMNFYSKVTKLPVEAIKPLAKRETYLNSKQLLDLGFATEILNTNINQTAKNYKAVAKLDIKMNDNKEVLTFLQKIEQGIKNLGNKFNAKAELVLIDEGTGKELLFPSLEPDQMPSAGDSVNAPDGSYVVSGMTIVVASGVVSEILEAEAMDDEKEAMKLEIESLKAMIEEKESVAKQKDEELAKLQTVAKAKEELEKQLLEVKAMVSIEDTEDYKRQSKKPEQKTTSSNFKEVLTKIKNKK